MGGTFPLMNFELDESCFTVTLTPLGSKMFQDVSKNMPRCHFLLIVTVVAIMSIYKDVETSMLFLRIGFVKLLTFRLFSKPIRYNTEMKN